MWKRFVVGVIIIGIAVGLGAATYAVGYSTADTAQADETDALATKGFGPSKPDESADYYNEEELQDSIFATYNSTPPVEHKAQEVSCIRIARRATCLIRTQTVNVPATVTISSDGQSYVAIAQP